MYIGVQDTLLCEDNKIRWTKHDEITLSGSFDHVEGSGGGWGSESCGSGGGESSSRNDHFVIPFLLCLLRKSPLVILNQNLRSSTVVYVSTFTSLVRQTGGEDTNV